MLATLTGMTVSIIGEAGEAVELHFANAAAEHADDGAGVPATAAAAAPMALEATSYAEHRHAYCDDGRAPSQHQHAYQGQNDTFAQCKAHCDALGCTCFDYKGAEAEAGAGRETMYRCRVSTVATTLTASGAGYNAFTAIAPPPPPLPPQLKHFSVKCTIGASGTAKVTIDAGVAQPCLSL